MIKELKSNGILVAQIYDMNKFEGVHFPTPETAAFQFGFGSILENKILVPHVHKRVKREIKTTSEFLYVIKGTMILDVIDEDEKFIDQVILNDMAILQFINKIEIKSGTRYEIKQGPYYGRDYDKYNLTNEYK